jgi:hypothetical protein
MALAMFSSLNAFWPHSSIGNTKNTRRNISALDGSAFWLASFYAQFTILIF